MTDSELAIELNIPVEAVPRLTPAKRAAYEHLIDVGRQLNEWQAGVAPRPEGVIVCYPHRRSR